MRCVMFILGGVAGLPHPSLDGRTPLSVARTPTLDDLALAGKVGRVWTAPRGLVPSREIAIQTLLGVTPDALVRGGGPFEAVGMGLSVGPEDAAYRVSLVTTLDGVLVDATAGRIGTAEAEVLLRDLGEELSSMNVAFGTGRGHRHVLVVRGRADIARTHAPKEVVGRVMAEQLPSDPEGTFLRGVMDRAHAVLSEHEVNRVRVDLGENPADSIWPFSGGHLVSMPSLPDRIGLSVAALADDPLAAGLANQAGLDVHVVSDEGASIAEGILDEASGRDLVLACTSRAAMAAGQDDPGARVRAIESLDREVMAPLVRGLAGMGPHRLLVVADRTTSRNDRSDPEASPFVFCGDGVSSVRRFPFDEKGCARSDLSVDEGHLLLDYLLGRPARL
jgi:2,3-bisphosphoglycerate-independent phosphoglycerate mutase